MLHSQYLDTERLKELSAFYAFVLLVALTNTYPFPYHYPYPFPYPYP